MRLPNQPEHGLRLRGRPRACGAAPEWGGGTPLPGPWLPVTSAFCSEARTTSGTRRPGPSHLNFVSGRPQQMSLAAATESVPQVPLKTRTRHVLKLVNNISAMLTASMQPGARFGCLQKLMLNVRDPINSIQGSAP